jgi:hypothetical protein
MADEIEIFFAGKNHQEEKIERQQKKAEQGNNKNISRLAEKINAEIDIVMEDNRLALHLPIKKPGKNPKNDIYRKSEYKIKARAKQRKNLRKSIMSFFLENMPVMINFRKDDHANKFRPPPERREY